MAYISSISASQCNPCTSNLSSKSSKSLTFVFLYLSYCGRVSSSLPSRQHVLMPVVHWMKGRCKAISSSIHGIGRVSACVMGECSPNQQRRNNLVMTYVYAMARLRSSVSEIIDRKTLRCKGRKQCQHISCHHQFGNTFASNCAERDADAAVTNGQCDVLPARSFAEDGQVVGRFGAQPCPHLIYSSPCQARQQSYRRREQPGYAASSEMFFKAGILPGGTYHNRPVIFRSKVDGLSKDNMLKREWSSRLLDGQHLTALRYNRQRNVEQALHVTSPGSGSHNDMLTIYRCPLGQPYFRNVVCVGNGTNDLMMRVEFRPKVYRSSCKCFDDLRGAHLGFFGCKDCGSDIGS